MAEDEILRLAELFGEVARTLAEHQTPDATLTTVVRLAVETLDSCEFAGISLVQGRKITSSAATGELPRTIDEIQSELDEGPSVDVIREHQVFQVRDLERERRWPRFSARAHAETGVSSIASFRLFIDGETMGALNLFSSQADAFDETDLALGAVFAAHAAVAMSGARREQNLLRRAASRDLIGQAKGMLMAGAGIDDEAAFEVLRRASQRLNRKLVEVADDVVHRRTIDGDPGPTWAQRDSNP